MTTEKSLVLVSLRTGMNTLLKSQTFVSIFLFSSFFLLYLCILSLYVDFLVLLFFLFYLYCSLCITKHIFSIRDRYRCQSDEVIKAIVPKLDPGHIITRFIPVINHPIHRDDIFVIQVIIVSIRAQILNNSTPTTPERTPLQKKCILLFDSQIFPLFLVFKNNTMSRKSQKWPITNPKNFISEQYTSDTILALTLPYTNSRPIDTATAV